MPQKQGHFLPQIPYFYILFSYWKTVALLILNKMKIIKKTIVSEIYAIILEILIYYFNNIKKKY